jgi:hypothetical protein
MKLSAKDIIAGALLIGLALIGLWLNQDHTLGSARRMGPGYMPMLVFWIQIGIGALVILLGLFSGPDPLEKWTPLDIATAIGGTVVAVLVTAFLARGGGALATNWYYLGIGLMAGFLVAGASPGWRRLGLVLAAFCVFGIVLDQGGLFLAIIACVVVAALADDTHTPLGVAGLAAFLVVLCWLIFIRELDIRVNVWPQFL